MNLFLLKFNFTIIASAILILVLLSFALWLFISGIIGAIRMLKSKHYKTTIGRVTDTEIRFKKFGGGDTNVSFNFVLIETYSYTVDGQNYTNNQTLASDSLYQKDYKPINQFPIEYGDYKKSFDYLKVSKNLKQKIGKPITVYYNPNEPAIACLDNRFNWSIFMPIIMGLLFSSWLGYLAYYFILPMLINLFR